ncbi:MAG: hypothetical protein JWM41_2266 [Gemmatimonadetes bacterium]|nr:hypothetical protein [Gemmatimonadota bacterium]
MRILHTALFYPPSVGGAQEVVRQISERLAARGHDVTVATSRLTERTRQVSNGVRIVEFDVQGSQTSGFRGDVSGYQDFLLSYDGDVMMNYAAQQWSADLVFPLLDRLPYAKIFAPCGFSALHDPSHAPYFRALPQTLSKYDRLIFHSDEYQDAGFARKHGLTNRRIIPNGCGADEFGGGGGALFRERYGIAKESPLLLSVGTHTGLKGHALVIDAFVRARIGPATLVIAGNALSSGGCAAACRRSASVAQVFSLGRKRVLVLDLSRAEIVAAYHAADLFVLGSAVECSPLVLFEAMASRTPFITTAAGNAAEIAGWGNSGILVPSRRTPDGAVRAEPADFARSIESLWRDETARRRMADDGRAAWRSRFTWETIAVEYEELYEEAVGARSSGAA